MLKTHIITVCSFFLYVGYVSEKAGKDPRGETEEGARDEDEAGRGEEKKAGNGEEETSGR